MKKTLTLHFHQPVIHTNNLSLFWYSQTNNKAVPQLKRMRNWVSCKEFFPLSPNLRRLLDKSSHTLRDMSCTICRIGPDFHICLASLSWSSALGYKWRTSYSTKKQGRIKNLRSSLILIKWFAVPWKVGIGVVNCPTQLNCFAHFDHNNSKVINMKETQQGN